MMASISNRTFIKNNRYVFYLFLAWTAFVVLSLLLTIRDQRRAVLKEAAIEARTHLELNLEYRTLISKFGGVYASVETISPNPYLNVPKRDVETKDGVKLTLLNPAYMTRLIFEAVKKKSSLPVINKITSLKSVNPMNVPDEWERKALHSFEKERKEATGITSINEEPYLRLMRPFITETSCLKCHGHQGYEEGDVRGAISIAVPLKPYYELAKQTQISSIIIYALFWLVGCVGLVVFSKFKQKQEQKLVKSEWKFRTVSESANDWEYWLSGSREIVYMSPVSKTITGYSPEEFRNNPDLLMNVIHPEDRTLYTNHVQNFEDDHHEEIEFRIISRNGQIKWLTHICAPLYMQNRFLGRRINNRDITDRKKAEEELTKYREHLEELIEQRTTELKKTNVELQSINDKLKAEIQVRERIQNALEQSEERYKRMVEAVTAYTYSVQVSKGNAIYTEHSIGCLPITGYSMDEFKSNPNLWYSMIYPDDKIMVENTIKEILAGHKAPTIEHRIIRRDGAVIWIRNTIAPYYNDDGALIRYDGLIEDISDRKHAAEELKCMSDELARSNTDLQQFAYAASHDLQEPLRVIAGFVKLLEKRYKHKLDTKAQEFIGFTINGVERMQQLIKDLLEYSQVGTKGLNLKPTDCSFVVEESISNLRASIEETGALVTHDELPILMVDASQMTRLFQNLIGNAIKFHGEQPSRVHVSAERKGDEWVFSVQDNGIGINLQHIERIFDVFQRLHTREKYSGTGIGLAICKRIVERHGGRIWVESEKGKGSTFYFTIPNREDNT